MAGTWDGLQEYLERAARNLKSEDSESADPATVTCHWLPVAYGLSPIYDLAGTILEPRAQAASASGQARTSTTAPPARHCGSRLGGRSSEAGRGGLRLLLVAQPEAQCHSLASNSKLRSVMVPGASPRCTRALTHRNRILGGVRRLGLGRPASCGSSASPAKPNSGGTNSEAPSKNWTTKFSSINADARKARGY